MKKVAKKATPAKATPATPATKKVEAKATPAPAIRIRPDLFTPTEGNPFPLSAGVIGYAWEMTKKGTTIDALVALCNQYQIEPGRVIRHMKRCGWKDQTWTLDFQPETGKIKLTPNKKAVPAKAQHPQLSPSAKKKVA